MQEQGIGFGTGGFPGSSCLYVHHSFESGWRDLVWKVVRGVHCM